MSTSTARAAVVLAVAAAVAGAALWRIRVRAAMPKPPPLMLSIAGWSEDPPSILGRREHSSTVFVRVVNTTSRPVRVPAFEPPRTDRSRRAEAWSELVTNVSVFGRKNPSAPWQEMQLRGYGIGFPGTPRNPNGRDGVLVQPGRSALVVSETADDWDAITEIKVAAAYEDTSGPRAVEAGPVAIHLPEGPAGPIPDDLPSLNWVPPISPNANPHDMLGPAYAQIPNDHPPLPDRMPGPAAIAPGSPAAPLLGADDDVRRFVEYYWAVGETNEPYLKLLARYESHEVAQRLEAYAGQIQGFPPFRSYVALVAAAFGSERARKLIADLPDAPLKTMVVGAVADVPVRSAPICDALPKVAAVDMDWRAVRSAVRNNCVSIVPVLADRARVSGGEAWLEYVGLHESKLAPALREATLARLRETLPALRKKLGDPTTLLDVAELDASDLRPAIEKVLAEQGGEAALGDPKAGVAPKTRVVAARYALARLAPERAQALIPMLREGWPEVMADRPRRGEPPDVGMIYANVHEKIVDELGRGPSTVAADALADVVRRHPNPRLVVPAIRALVRHGAALAVPRLMALLQTDTRRRAHDKYSADYAYEPHIARALRELTGQPFGTDAETWRAWWAVKGGT